MYFYLRQPSKMFAAVLLAVMASVVAEGSEIPPIPIPGLCNTGVVGPCNGGTGIGLQTVGSVDLNWELSLPAPTAPSSAPPTAVPAAATFGPGTAWVNAPDGSWLANGPNSAWITPQAENAVGGYYFYQTTFTIPSGYDPSTAVISGMFTSDNEGIAIFLNGSPVSFGVVYPGPGGSGLPFTGSFTLSAVNAPFMNGTNTLVFEIRNRGIGGIDSSNTPTGLRVEFNPQISAVAPPPPPPLQTGNPVYTQDTNLTDFTSCPLQPFPGGSGYATFVLGDLSSPFTTRTITPSDPTTWYTPTSTTLASTPFPPRVTGNDASPPIIVDFGLPGVSQIVVFDNLDHVCNASGNGNGNSGWDAYQYEIYGGNSIAPGSTFYLLFDPLAIAGGPDNSSGNCSSPTTPYTLAKWSGQGPTLVNNTLTPGPGNGSGAVGYEAYFDFTSYPTGRQGPYRYYAFRTSTFAYNASLPDSGLGGEVGQELSAVAAAVPCSFLEVCKSSSSVSPVTGSFTFTSSAPSGTASAPGPVVNAFTTIPGNSITVPVGSCSGPLPVIPGPVTITESATTGVGLESVVASGYDPSTLLLDDRLISFNPPGSATVTAVSGDVSFETIATFTNQGTTVQGTAGQLKICKIAGPGIKVGTTFNFTATSGTPAISQSYTVPAGPPSEGGYCVIDSTTFPLGTKVTVAEVFNPLLLPYTVTSVVSPAGTTGTNPIVATLGAGFTEVTFTNSSAGIGPFLGDWNTGLSFSNISGGVPITRTIPLTSTPSVPFTAAATVTSGPPGWLTVSPLQGTTPATITVSVAALPAGTYSGAIAINSADPANPLSSTVPVTFVVAPAGQLSSQGSMAQLAFAGNWTTNFTLVNTGTQPVQASLNFFDNNGSPLPVPLAFPQSGTAAGSPVSTATVTVNPGAGQVVQTAGLTSQPTQVGWTQLQATGSLDGFAVFQQANGSSIQEAVVPLENINPTAFEIWFDNTGGNATGIALANAVAQGATVPVTIRDDTGAILLSTTTTLAADGHTSFDLASTYAQTSGKRGTVEFDTPAGGQISVLGIQFNPAGAFSTIPALAATSAGSASSGSMAQLAFAGGWTTAFTLVNTGTAPVQATLNFFDNNGNPLPVPLVFPQSGTTAAPAAATTTLTVNPGAGQLIQTAGLASQPTETGWTQLVATGNLGGFAVFQQANGSRIQEAVVPLETLNPSAFVIWFDNTGGNATGIALANAVAQGASIPVVIRDDTGAILLSTTTTLAADGHTSFDLAGTYAQTSGIRGTVEFNTPAGGQISVLGIEFSPAGAFTTIPALTK